MPAPHSHLRPTSLTRFHIGAAYYPEHWDAAIRATDAPLMQASGVTCVRMAEFAWALMEPRPGEFKFELFDETIAEMAAHGIQTVLCTPTAAPPRWLSFNHPEILRVNEEGRRFEHGGRVHANYASPLYRECSRRITQAMADHYQTNENVIGWQTDNEFLCGFTDDHSPATRTAFVEWLRRRYNGDIDALNAAWGNVFWGQTYSRFEEIPTPLAKPAGPGPGHRLDYYRFLSDVIVEFQGEQVDILRRANPRWWITHNGCFPRLDYRGEFGRQLDVLGYDNYPTFEISPRKRAANNAFNLDRTRAWTGNFLILEQLSGAGGGGSRMMDTPEPGEIRRMAYSATARGADGIFFFNWRTCRFAHEIYWGGLIDHDNIPRRRFEEFAQFAKESARFSEGLLGTSVVVEAAVAASDNDVQGGDDTCPLGLPGPKKMAEPVHKWLFEHGYAVGCVHPSDALSRVKIYVIPHWTLFHPDWVPRLEEFVNRGGTLVIGARTATRDWRNQVVADTPPGLLRHLSGIRVEEYGKRNAPEERPLSLRWEGQPQTTEAGIWYEDLLPAADVEILARWEGQHLTGHPAVTLRRHGLGKVIYVGAYLEAPMVAALMPQIVALTDLRPILPDTPERVEVVVRQKAGLRLWFLINHNETPVTLQNAPEGIDLLTDRPATAPLTLQPNAVALIESRV